MTAHTTASPELTDPTVQSLLAGDIHPGMSFDQRVWAVTARIPSGQIATYAQIAHALNCRAYRAVGAALGRNPYAPAVPCHRVVGSDRSLCGFARGLDAKAALLRQEGVPVSESGRVGAEAVFCDAGTLAGPPA